MAMADWDQRYLDMAQLVAGWSKDPGTQVGCVIVRPDRTVASCGYNGMARGMNDAEHLALGRSHKLALTLHSEENALLSAHERLDGCTAYIWPIPPCSQCASKLVQAGIKRVVSPAPNDRWYDSCVLGASVLRECGVESEWREVS